MADLGLAGVSRVVVRAGGGGEEGFEGGCC